MNKKLIIVILTAICVLFLGLNIKARKEADTTAPEITVPSSLTMYDENQDVSQLLTGVTATDDTDGDVTDSLRVSSILPNTENNTAVVVYTAKDSHNNVAKLTVVLGYKAKEVPVQETPAEEPETDETGAADNQSDTDTQTVAQQQPTYYTYTPTVQTQTDTNTTVDNGSTTPTDENPQTQPETPTTPSTEEPTTPTDPGTPSVQEPEEPTPTPPDPTPIRITE